MSLILDALNKADRERQDNESPPGLQSNHNFLIGQEKMAGWKKTVVIVVIALVLVAAAIAYHLGKRSGSPPPAVAGDAAATITVPSAATSVQPADNPAPRVTEPTPPITKKVIQPANTAVAAASQTAETRSLLQKQRIEEQYRKAQAAKEKSTAAPADSKSKSKNGLDNISALYQSTASQKQNEPDTVQPTADPRTASAPSSQAGNSPATVNAHPSIGSVRDLPWSAQEKIPTLMYTEHSYTDSPNDYVTINGERKTKGQKIANILTVDSILEDGVVIRYENHQFKMPALNSWINM